MKLRAALALAMVLPAYADFSYKVSRSSGGTMAAVIGNEPAVSTYYYKDRKAKIDSGARATIIDFNARTVSTIDTAKKTVAVKSFDDVNAGAGGGPEITIDVRETGAKKTVNGFDASETILTMHIEIPQARQMGKMQVEDNLWLSGSVPGVDQLIAFHKRNEAGFPWAAMQAGAGANSSMQAAMAQAQRKIAAMHGIPVRQVIRLRAANGSSDDSAQMQGAVARLEALKAQGGEQAALAEQMLARMGGGAALVEITMDLIDFSDATIPDSVFEIPADYQKVN